MKKRWMIDLDEDGLEFSAAGLMKKKIDGWKTKNFFTSKNRRNLFRLENPLDRLIIHAITWLPVNMFTTAVMESAVDCWSWAIVGRPELELLVRRKRRKCRKWSNSFRSFKKFIVFGINWWMNGKVYIRANGRSRRRWHPQKKMKINFIFLRSIRIESFSK